MIQALRFVDRQGKKILQQAVDIFIVDGEMSYKWVDVPLHTIEVSDAVTPGKSQREAQDERQGA